MACQLCPSESFFCRNKVCDYRFAVRFVFKVLLFTIFVFSVKRGQVLFSVFVEIDVLDNVFVFQNEDCIEILATKFVSYQQEFFYQMISLVQ